MNNDHSSTYRGCSITTRCVEVRRATDWAELDTSPSSWAKRFTASFTVEPDAADDESWQQFPQTAFKTSDQAIGHALAAAKRSIDLKLAEV